jgi:DNA replication and repair protein RecF
VHLRRIQLKNFRNYSELDLTLPTGNLLLLGENAQGKSNLLEAVFMLASARAVRASSDGELIAWQAEAAPQPVTRLTAAVERAEGPLQLEAIIVGAAPVAAPAQVTRAGKRLRVNGIPRRGADFVGMMRAVLFTADDLGIVTGAPSERRRFLDSMLSQLDRRYYAAIHRYTRVLQQRNAALKRVKDGHSGADELGFWDDSLVAEGATIIDARFRAARQLAPLAAFYHRNLSGEAAEALEVTYCPRLGESGVELGDGYEGREQVAAALKSGLQHLRRREIAAGQSLVGPHRDEVTIRINGASAAAFGSRAQVRTAGLSLRLAEARLMQQDIGDAPVLLLDDIVSELDERRRRSVLASIADFDQVWFTATDTHGFEPAFLETATVYRVAGGRVERGV